MCLLSLSKKRQCLGRGHPHTLVPNGTVSVSRAVFFTVIRINMCRVRELGVAEYIRRNAQLAQSPSARRHSAPGSSHSAFSYPDFNEDRMLFHQVVYRFSLSAPHAFMLKQVTTRPITICRRSVATPPPPSTAFNTRLLP